MKTNRLIVMVVIAVLLAGQAFAVVETVTEPAQSTTSYYKTADGAPMAAFAHSQLGILDRLRLASLSGGGLTMIGGALCSTFADKEAQYTPASTSATQVCYTNNGHIGVAFQMFQIEPWTFLGEKQLTNGQTACFNVAYGKQYLQHWYYCDQTGKTCTDYVSTKTCNDASLGGPWTMRECDCIENGKTTHEAVKVSWYDPGAPIGCVATPTDDDDDATASGGGTAGGSTDNGGTTTTSCKGKWDDFSCQSNVRPGEPFECLGKFTPSTTGECIFSSNMVSELKTTLSVVEAKGSACGQSDPYVAEARVKTTAGKQVEIDFVNMKARDNVGTHNVYAAAWDGCAKDGGKEVAITFAPTNVLTLQGEIDQGLAVVGGLGGLLMLVAFGLVIVGLAIYLLRK